MTDADVDGAHIASLLITFFYQEMPELIENGHLFLAVPPLYKIHARPKSLYARNEKHRDELIANAFQGKPPRSKVTRFKGLGEMDAQRSERDDDGQEAAHAAARRHRRRRTRARCPSRSTR